MRILKTIAETRKELAQFRNKSIGLVPTMGFFHEGHLSLMEQARQECDIVVVSLFVNPTQFGQGEDFEQYPRDELRDAELAQSTGIDYIFQPSVKEMYPESFNTTVVPGSTLTDKMCGSSRSGHFEGVATVVTKLFNIIQPERAYFGQKDAQQLVVIKSFVRDLNLPIEIIGMPIIREEDGLAKSSRNIYLSHKEREQALGLYRAICLGEGLVKGGLLKRSDLIRKVKEYLLSQPGLEVDYFEAVQAEDLSAPNILKGKIILAGAVKVGSTRLIDNKLLEV